MLLPGVGARSDFTPGVTRGVVASPFRGPSRTPRDRGVDGCSWVQTQAVLGASLCSWVSASAGRDPPCRRQPRMWVAGQGSPTGAGHTWSFSAGTLFRGCSRCQAPQGSGLDAALALRLQLAWNDLTTLPSPGDTLLGRGAQGTGRLHPGGCILPRCFPTMESPWSSGLPSPPLASRSKPSSSSCAGLERSSQGEISSPPLLCSG